MSKFIDAEKLRSVLQNTINSMKEKDVKGERYDAFLNGKLSICEELLGCIDSLQQEQPDKYETALEKARKWMPNVNQGGHAILIDIFPELGEGLDPRYGGRKQEQPHWKPSKEQMEALNAVANEGVLLDLFNDLLKLL